MATIRTCPNWNREREPALTVRGHEGGRGAVRGRVPGARTECRSSACGISTSRTATGPQRPYAAVIPRWTAALLRGKPVEIYGDGETSRDFCFLANAIQASILAATNGRPESLGETFSVAVGENTTLNELFRVLRERLARHAPAVADVEAQYRDFRAGDVRLPRRYRQGRCPARLSTDSHARPGA